MTSLPRTIHAEDPAEGPVDVEPGGGGSSPGRRHRWLAAGAFGAAVAGVAVLGSRFSPAEPGTARWYRSLDKPPFQPPNAVFAPVWSTLYPTIAVSGWRVWQAEDQPRRRVALGLWAAQLAANAAWTPTFFGARRPKVALGVLAAQLASTVAYTATARSVDRPAAILMAPYLAWSGFAGALNEEIVRRNP